MSPFQPHFRAFPNGAPYPGTCIRCGNNRDLFELGFIAQHEYGVYYCGRCISELAVWRGFVTSESFASQQATLSGEINKLKSQLDATPNLLKEFQSDVTNLITNFVTSLASVPVSNQPVQLESDQADTGEPAAEPGPSTKSGKGKKQTSEPSAESAE